MKKILLVLLFGINSCTNNRTAIVVDVTPTNTICSYLFKTYDITDPYIYELDSCGKWELGDTVLISGLK